MRTISIIIILSIALLHHSGCSKPGCLGSKGAIVTHERMLSAFDSLVVEDNIEVELVQSSTNKVEITAGENILPNVLTINEGHVLRISNSTDCRWLRDASERIRLRLFFTDLSHIEYKASGDLRNADTLRMNRLLVESTIGAGDIDLTIDMESFAYVIFSENAGVRLRGRAAWCGGYTDARSQLDLSQLTARTIDIEYGGLGDTEVHATEELSVRIFYHGNVYYRGNPLITRKEEFSTGRLIHLP